MSNDPATEILTTWDNVTKYTRQAQQADLGFFFSGIGVYVGHADAIWAVHGSPSHLVSHLHNTV